MAVNLPGLPIDIPLSDSYGRPSLITKPVNSTKATFHLTTRDEYGNRWRLVPDVGGVYTIGSSPPGLTTTVHVATKLTHTLEQGAKITMFVQGGVVVEVVEPSATLGNRATPRIDAATSVKGKMAAKDSAVVSALASLVGMDASQVLAAMGPSGAISVAWAAALADSSPTIDGEDPTAASLVLTGGWAKE